MNQSLRDRHCQDNSFAEGDKRGWRSQGLERVMKLTSANKRHVRLAIKALGYDIQKSHSPELGRDPFVDITKLTGSQSGLVVFDVGANVGQSIESFRNSLFLPEIHAFEPNRDIFGDLENKFAG